MIKTFFTAAIYAAAFCGIVYFVSPLAGFDSQETNLLYLFSAVLIYAGIIAPAMDEAINSHNEKAKELIDKEHEELMQEEKNDQGE